MAFNFYEYLKLRDGDIQNMPAITITRRVTDKFITFDPKKTRFDRIAGDFYSDETLKCLLQWANPDVEYEFDIPRGTIIRVPFPKDDVIAEVVAKINLLKNR